MGITLSPGANAALATVDGAPARFTAIAGWSHRSGSTPFDVDLAAVVCGSDGLALSDDHFVYFNNPTSPDGSVRISTARPPARTAADLHAIDIDLDAAPVDAARVVLAAIVYDPTIAEYNFDRLDHAFIRIVGEASGELVRFEIASSADSITAMVLGEMYRRGPQWKFRAIGQGYSDGIDGLGRDYGLEV